MKTQAALLVIVGLVLASYVLDAQDVLDGWQANYCSMRQIYIDSSSEYGWPRMDNYGECK